MSKAEKFISDCTRNCSNKWYDDLSQGYESWLTPNQARRAVEIAREETTEKIKELLLSEVLPCFMHGGEADEVVAMLDYKMMKDE